LLDTPFNTHIYKVVNTLIQTHSFHQYSSPARYHICKLSFLLPPFPRPFTEMSSDPTTEEKPSQTYECGCHCGYIKFSMTLSPPLTGQPEGQNYKVNQCNCSVCTRLGYLLVYPVATEVVWRNDGRARCANYQFNTKQKDQMFCPKCGTSLGIDFREVHSPHCYGISVCL
jgi:hypothetical protein